MAHIIELTQLANTTQSVQLAFDSESKKELTMTITIGESGYTYISFNIFVNNLFIDTTRHLTEAISKYNQIAQK